MGDRERGQPLLLRFSKVVLEIGYVKTVLTIREGDAGIPYGQPGWNERPVGLRSGISLFFDEIGDRKLTNGLSIVL